MTDTYAPGRGNEGNQTAICKGPEDETEINMQTGRNIFL
jgi:hypothetical protein